jgi:hypothetical protein
MATTYVTLNGTQLKPKLPMDMEEFRVGESVIADNGTETFHHDAYKCRWTLTHDNASEALRATWRALWRTVGAMTFINEQGQSFTVRSESFKAPVKTLGSSGTATYTLELVIVEQ